MGEALGVMCKKAVDYWIKLFIVRTYEIISIGMKEGTRRIFSKSQKKAPKWSARNVSKISHLC